LRPLRRSPGWRSACSSRAARADLAMAVQFRSRRVPRLLQPAVHAKQECSVALGQRWELARPEWNVELRRLVQAATGLAILALGGLLVLIFLGLALVVTRWDTDHRVLVAWLVVGGYAALGLIGLFMWRFAEMRKDRRFAALRAELAADREWVGRQFRRSDKSHD